MTVEKYLGGYADAVKAKMTPQAQFMPTKSASLQNRSGADTLYASPTPPATQNVTHYENCGTGIIFSTRMPIKGYIHLHFHIPLENTFRPFPQRTPT